VTYNVPTHPSHSFDQNTPHAKQLYQAFRAQTLTDLSAPASPLQRAAPAAKQARAVALCLFLCPSISVCLSRHPTFHGASLRRIRQEIICSMSDFSDI
jgi:hypothetical protein